LQRNPLLCLVLIPRIPLSCGLSYEDPDVSTAVRNGRRTSLFTSFANATAKASGHHLTFLLAVFIILAWGVSGPIFKYSDTWQLVINTGTTIVTFLMVFLIQNTQNRDSTAMHLKLDEIIRALDGAHNTLMNLEDMEDKELEAMHERYVALAERARGALERGELDTAVAEIEELKDVRNAELGDPAPQSEGTAAPARRAGQAGSRN
jgi:low affinity Fe/Cu permease